MTGVLLTKTEIILRSLCHLVRSKITSVLKAFPSGKAYLSCTDLPLYNFIKIVITGELKWLVIWGWPSGLAENWEKIFEQYLDINPDKEQSGQIKGNRDLQVLQTKLYLLKLWIRVIENSSNKKYVEDAKAGINRLGYYEVDNIDRLLSRTKLLEVQVKELAEEQKPKKQQKEEPLIETTFDKTLVALAKGLNFDIIDSKKITVSTYCALQERLNAEIQHATKRNHR